MVTASKTLRTVTDEESGYEFGCDGLMSRDEACQFLGGMSVDTLEELALKGEVRRGKMPGGRKLFFCRRSVREFAKRTEI